jgi:hypothetical protein
LIKNKNSKKFECRFVKTNWNEYMGNVPSAFKMDISKLNKSFVFAMYEAATAYSDWEKENGKVMPCRCKTFNGSYHAKIAGVVNKNPNQCSRISS